jgi:hypothetical protein
MSQPSFNYSNQGRIVNLIHFVVPRTRRRQPERRTLRATPARGGDGRRMTGRAALKLAIFCR